MTYIGVDACKRGWVAIELDEGNHWRVDTFSDMADLWSQCKSSKLILIDIPIGLNRSGSDERGCDKAARKLLGHKRGSSVFPVPCRQAVYADAEEASEVNREITCRKLSKQSLGIIRKIRQVDQFLQGDRAACARIRETHPELCFLALNRGQPMEHSKKTRDGFSERVSVFPEAVELVRDAEARFPRKDVSRDDILDSLVAAITASKEMTFCVEVEISRRTDRLEHAIEKLSSSACGGGFLIVPRDAVGKAEELVGDRPIISIPIDKFSILCKLRRQGLSQSSTTK